MIRILGDYDLAEEALQEAFKAALEKWPVEGIPENPVSWLISTGKFKAIDSIRRLKRGRELISENLTPSDEEFSESHFFDETVADDDQLRLIFFCCHPSLPQDSQIALSLRDVCGMKSEDIARAYLISNDAIKKRISRAKRLFREKNIPYEIPAVSEIPHRINAVLHVIYLIYNEGYSASTGQGVIRKDLTDEAVYLSRKLAHLTPTSESLGLLALLLLQESRRKARVSENGDLIPLENQNRSLWDQNLIREGMEYIHQAVKTGRLGPYTIQAAISSVHAVADSVQDTHWNLIVDYYDLLLSINPSPFIELNRAIALGMLEGPEAGLAIIDKLIGDKELESYHVLWAARADLSKKAGLINEAIDAYRKAIKRTGQEPGQRYLQQQLDELLKK